MQTRNFLKINPDALGIAASLACAVHCILLPVLFTSLPLLGIDLLENQFLEMATILVSMGVGAWVLWRGYKHGHIRGWMVICFIMGLLFVIIGNFVNITLAEALLKFTGAALIITVHAINWRQYRRTCATGPAHKHQARHRVKRTFLGGTTG